MKSRNLVKVCGYCGQQQRNNWTRHFARNHIDADEPLLQWDGISLLKGNAWCGNWEEVIKDGAEPENVQIELKDGHKSSKNPDPAQNQNTNNKQDISLLITSNTSNIEVVGIADDKAKARVQSENLLKKCVLNKIGGQNQKGGNQNNQINKNNGFSLNNQNKKRQKVGALEAQLLAYECDQALKCNIMQHQNIVDVVKNVGEVPKYNLTRVIDDLTEENQNNVEITTNPAMDQQFSEIAAVGPQKVNENIWDNCFNGLQQVQHTNVGYLNTSIASNKDITFDDQVKDIRNKKAPTTIKQKEIALQKLRNFVDQQDDTVKSLLSQIIEASDNCAFEKHRIKTSAQMSIHKKVFKEMCPDDYSSDINVSSLASSQVVDFYRSNQFPDVSIFEEDFTAAEDGDRLQFKEKAYKDKVLMRESQYWEKKIQEIQQEHSNLELIVEQKAAQILQLQHQLLDLTQCMCDIKQTVQNELQQKDFIIVECQTTIQEQISLIQKLRIDNTVTLCAGKDAFTQAKPLILDAENDLIQQGYSQVQLVGQGGFGVVFKACKDQTRFAIKIPIRADCKNEIIFMKQIESTGYLNKQFVVPIIAEILIQKRPSFVMNYYEKTLVDFIKENHSMEQIKVIFYFIMRGVSAAHTHKPVITHRDIKPANILFNRLMCPLIADWGLASQDSQKFTGGTCSYMDPRIWNQAKSAAQTSMQRHHQIKPPKSIIDYKSADVWSLGIVFYFMLEKKHPFTKDQLVSWRDSSTDIKMPLHFTAADNQLSIFIASMLQLDHQKRPSVVQLLQSSVFAEVIKDISMFADPVDLRHYFRNEYVQPNLPQVATTFTEKLEAESAQETINSKNQISSVFSISTLRHPSDMWRQQELNVQKMLNAVNENSLLEFFKQQKKRSASIKDIWNYFSRLFAGEVLSFIKVSEFIERIKITNSSKLKLREESPYNRDQSLLSLCQDSTKTHTKQSPSQLGIGIAIIDSSVNSDSISIIDDLVSIDSSEFNNVRNKTLAEFAQMDGIIAERAVKYIQTIENNKQFSNAIVNNNSNVNHADDNRHFGVDISLQTSPIVLDANLCVAKNEVEVVSTLSVLGKRRRQHTVHSICETCSKGFKTSAHKAKHIYKVHSDKGKTKNQFYTRNSRMVA